MTIQPDRGYWKSRAELLNYELAAFAALRAGVPDCYRDGGDNTAWGWILHALARKVGALDYLDQYQLISRNPALLTVPDLLRQVVPLLPLNRDYPNGGQFDLELRTMVLRLLRAYRQGARLPALSAVIEAFTGADPSSFSITELYTLIGTPGIDCSYRNTIRIEVPFTTGAFASSPQLVRDVYQALAATKAAHVGIELIGVFPSVEDASGKIKGIRDRFQVTVVMTDGAPQDPELSLAPCADPSAPDTALAPAQPLDLSYQWYKDGVLISGATGASLSVTAALTGSGPSETQLYYAVVSDPLLGSVASMQAPMRVSALGQTRPPALPALAPITPATGELVISYQPMSFSVLAGETVQLTVAAANRTQPGVLVPHRNRAWVIKSDRWSSSASRGQLALTGQITGSHTTP